MKLINKDAALAAISFIPDEVRPMKGYYLYGLVRAIAERYAFSTVPTVKEAGEAGARYKFGRLVKDGREIPILEMGVFNDTFTATTHDTLDAEHVVHDLFAWLKQAFQFRDPVNKFRYLFQSDLIVEFDNDPADQFVVLAPLFDFLQKAADKTMGAKSLMQFKAISFGVEAGLVPHFQVERRVGSPWSSKRYFCKAHLPTDTHIRALELLDELMKR
jgi:hypothetical protein